MNKGRQRAKWTFVDKQRLVQQQNGAKTSKIQTVGALRGCLSISKSWFSRLKQCKQACFHVVGRLNELIHAVLGCLAEKRSVITHEDAPLVAKSCLRRCESQQLVNSNVSQIPTFTSEYKEQIMSAGAGLPRQRRNHTHHLPNAGRGTAKKDYKVCNLRTKMSLKLSFRTKSSE